MCVLSNLIEKLGCQSQVVVKGQESHSLKTNHDYLNSQKQAKISHRLTLTFQIITHLFATRMKFTLDTGSPYVPE